MPILPRAQFHSAGRPGVVYLVAGDGERHYYIRYRTPDGKQRFEKAVIRGVRMSAAKADQLRQDGARGISIPNRERRKEERAAKETEAGKWTFDKLWKAWKADPENAGKRGTVKADQRYRKHIKEPFGDREPSSLKPIDIDRLRLSLAMNHAKATTISILGLIRRIERYGASKNLCAGLSFPIILKGKKLGKEPRIKKAPSDEQVESYIKTCE